MKTIAFIGTGGTIAAVGADRFDVLDYNAADTRLSASELIAQSGFDGVLARIHPVDFRSFDSTAVSLDDWCALANLCAELAAAGHYDGIVIGHGTASLEETAFVLSLVLDAPLAVVLTGAMRPWGAVSADGPANLAAAIRLAGSGQARGVLVVMNDEIHAPRTVAKTDTLRVHSFRSLGPGPLGHIDGATVRITSVPMEYAVRFTCAHLAALPRVDVCYSHVGADSTAIRAFVAAGARGIVSAGFGPGMATPAELVALTEAVQAGVKIVQSSRVGAGQVVDSIDHRARGIIAGGSLSPQKARILLALCLARGDDAATITNTFANF